MPKRRLTTALGMVACLALAGACASNDEMLEYHPAVDGPRMGDDIRTPQDESRDHDDSDSDFDRRAVSMSNTDSSSAVVTNLNVSDATPAATLIIGTAPATRATSQFYSDRPRYVGSVSAADAQENSGLVTRTTASPSVSVGITPTIVASDRQVSSTVNAAVVPGVVNTVPSTTGAGLHANRLLPPQQMTTGSTNVSVSDVAVTPTVAAGSSPVTSTVNATVPTAAVDPTTTPAVRGETVPNATVAAPAVEVVDTDRATNQPATTTAATGATVVSPAPSVVAATSSRLTTTAAAEGEVSTTSGDGESRVRIENDAATGKTTTTRRTTTTRSRRQ